MSSSIQLSRALASVGLDVLMKVSRGRSEVTIAVLDGPVATELDAFAHTNIRRLGQAVCKSASTHGTAVTAVLAARRGSAAPGICPGCTILVHPVLAVNAVEGATATHVGPGKLGEAIAECVDGGARILNLSLGLDRPFGPGVPILVDALSYAAQRGAVVVAAAGNESTVYTSPITRHPAVVPVVAFGLDGRPLSMSTLGHAIAQRGIGAPGVGIDSLRADGSTGSFTGTSIATPFVTGCIALLWSVFTNASATEIRSAVRLRNDKPRRGIVPPLLNAYAAYRQLSARRSLA
jgi:subtilisin family serine protease